MAASVAGTVDKRIAKYDTCGAFQLFHVNGIMTEETGANANLDRIRVVYGNAYKEHLVVYKLAYNKTQGLAKDFIECAMQVMKGYAGATWDKFMNAVTFGVYSLGMSTTASAEVAKKVTDLFAFTKPSPYQNEDLNDITNKIMTQSTGGRRLLFCHSQGNLYCNLVYDKLVAGGMRPETIGLVGLAVPYSSLKTGNTHTTSFNDVVIDAVRVATVNNVLTPTITIPYAPTVDALGHNLIKTYFAYGPAQTQIKANIDKKFGEIKSGYGNGSTPVYPTAYPVTYASLHWTSTCGQIGSPTGWTELPECYKYWSVTQFYDMSQYVTVMPGSVSAAKTQLLANAQACYSLAVAGIKKAQLAQPVTTYPRWAWFTMGYPNNYGCWDMISGHPSSDYRLGAWWLYGADKPPVFKLTYVTHPHDYPLYAEGGAVCN